ncbi:MAG: S-layer homology domain-containing protein, partial [Oscillibacter sp.]|nr:S-layer homology domain-containing protein [Oscillibacter sp.]
ESDAYKPTSLAQAMKEIAADVASGLAAGNPNPDTKTDVTVTLKTQTVQDFTLDTRPMEDLTPEEKTAKHEQGEILNQTSGYYDSAEQVKLDFLEISMEQTVTEKNGDEVVKTETQTVNTAENKIRVVEIPLRYNLTGRYNPMVFRFHGTASALRRLASRPKDYQMFDGCFYISGRGNDAVIYIYSNKFSTYSIATSETEAYTVLFDTDGGSAVNSQTIPASGTAEKPADPVRSGYDFAGWYLRNSDTEFDFSTEITEDIHLVARWTEQTTPSTPVTPSTPGSSSRSSGGKSKPSVVAIPRDTSNEGTPTPDTDSGTDTGSAKGYTTESPALPSVTGVDEWLITDTHPAYIGGFSDGTFRPNANISRAQAAAMFYRLLKNPNVARTTSFSDMTGNEWYAEAVYTLSSMGIIQGYSDGSFHGNDTISRAAFAAIAARLSKTNGETGTGVTFSDVPSTHWAHDTIAQASYYGWIGGYSNGTFNPSAPITRAAVTAVINRMLGRSADQQYVSAHSGELNQFSDVRDPAAWYYYNVAEAANSHGFTVTDGNETWNSTTP